MAGIQTLRFVGGFANQNQITTINALIDQEPGIELDAPLLLSELVHVLESVENGDRGHAAVKVRIDLEHFDALTGNPHVFDAMIPRMTRVSSRGKLSIFLIHSQDHPRTRSTQLSLASSKILRIGTGPFQFDTVKSISRGYFDNH